jgi:MucB/RseB N-terminal domain
MSRTGFALARGIVAAGLTCILTAESAPPSSEVILERLENETNRRHALLTEYSGTRQYTMQNQRFGKRAAVEILMNYRQSEGEHYTVLARSGSDKLNEIIDKVISSEASASVPPDNARHQITAANYQARLLGTGPAAGRTCYVLALTPRRRSRYLIAGKIWVDTGSYAVVRIEGQFATSLSALVGAPRITEEFTDVHGFWLPLHLRCVTSSFLLGPTALEIAFSNYQGVGRESTPQ